MRFLDINNYRLPALRTKTVAAKGVLGMSRSSQRHVFESGRVLMYISFVLFASSFASSVWVRRNLVDSYEQINTNVRDNELITYGVWRVCDKNGECDFVTKIHNVNIASALTVQSLVTMALLGYGMSIILELSSHASLFSALAENRAPEFVFALSAVIHFMSLVVFTGEIKNRAERTLGSVDVAGWAFVASTTGVFCAVLASCIMALFRCLPIRRKRRRFWKLPQELRTRPILKVLNKAVAEKDNVTSTSPIRMSEPPRAN
ncbi:uncharacterized protein LOC112570595 isoform X1 [Pomacea canaliculata]|uniref:uncharacterized protein LOC112570595 isoform X1 n=1 Tax=Pomacea canaliculata TaxID=400727 RepID=UPI000D72BD70|nr:uncharacterized protein LOC112570595 isoform X1 [Pomacea canaliculata]